MRPCFTSRNRSWQAAL